MSHYKTIQSLGTPHIVHQGLIDFLDDLELAVMLNHLLYWSDKTDNPLGIYRSNEEWLKLFRFKDAKVKKLSDELEKRGLITKTHKRLEHRIYYLFNSDEFDRQYGDFLAVRQSSNDGFPNLNNDYSPIAKIKIGETQKDGLADSQNGDSLYTKITTKNTYKDYSKESEYDTHTHENENSQNSQNPKKPKTTAKNSKSDNSSVNKKSKSDSRLNPNGIEKPAELDNQIWLDFLKVKKQRTKDDLSVTAWNRFINPVLLAQQKTNHSLDEIFGFWIAETKWVGFNCDWYLNRLNGQNQSFANNTPNRKDEFRDEKWQAVFGDNFYGNSSDNNSSINPNQLTYIGE